MCGDQCFIPGQDPQPGVLPRPQPQGEEAAAEVLGPEHGLVVGEPVKGEQGRVPPAQAGTAPPPTGSTRT